MSKMSIAAKDRPHVKLECLRLLVTLKLNRAQQDLIAGFVDTYLQLSKAETENYNRELQTMGISEQ